MQSGRIRHDIFVRQPKGYLQKSKRSVEGQPKRALKKQINLPYGIVEAERQWLCAIQISLLNTYEMERVLGIDQLFVKRTSHGAICRMMAKVVDDFLLSGSQV